MKRDLDFIREILLFVEENDDGSGQEIFGTDEHDKVDLEKRNFHIRLLEDAGFIEVSMLPDDQYQHISWYLAKRMTMAGHVYLNGVRDPKIWKHIKNVISKGGKQITIAAVQAYISGSINPN